MTPPLLHVLLKSTKNLKSFVQSQTAWRHLEHRKLKNIKFIERIMTRLSDSKKLIRWILDMTVSTGRASNVPPAWLTMRAGSLIRYTVHQKSSEAPPFIEPLWTMVKNLVHPRFTFECRYPGCQYKSHDYKHREQHWRCAHMETTGIPICETCGKKGSWALRLSQIIFSGHGSNELTLLRLVEP